MTDSERARFRADMSDKLNPGPAKMAAGGKVCPACGHEMGDGEDPADANNPPMGDDGDDKAKAFAFLNKRGL